jgi:hypothetical protein
MSDAYVCGVQSTEMALESNRNTAKASQGASRWMRHRTLIDLKSLQDHCDSSFECLKLQKPAERASLEDGAWLDVYKEMEGST